MAGNGDKSDKILAGMRLILGEIRDLKLDIRDLRADMKEHMARADEDRRKSDQRFEFLVETIREERKQSDRQSKELVRSALQVGRRILDKLGEHGKILGEHTTLLKEIRRGVNGNGRSGNGHPRK